VYTSSPATYWHRQCVGGQLSGTHWQLTWHHLFISGITSKGGTAEHTALALSGEVVVAVMVGTEVVVVATEVVVVAVMVGTEVVVAAATEDG